MIHRISTDGGERGDRRPPDDAHDAFRRAIPVHDARQIDHARHGVRAHQREAEPQIRRNSRTQPFMKRGRLNCAARAEALEGHRLAFDRAGGLVRRQQHVERPALDETHQRRPAGQRDAERGEERRRAPPARTSARARCWRRCRAVRPAAGRRGRRRRAPPRAWRRRGSARPAAPETSSPRRTGSPPSASWRRRAARRV